MRKLKRTIKKTLNRQSRRKGLSEREIWDGMDMYQLRRHIVIDPGAIQSSMRRPV
jgi:hypothetical protein